MGKQTADLLESALASHNKSSDILATILGIVTLIATASGVFGEMQSALKVIWKAELKGSTVSRLVRARAASLGLVAMMGFLLMVSLAVSAALTSFGHQINALLPFGSIILAVINGAISLLLVSLMFAAVYKVLPDRNIEWRDVMVGAVATAVMFSAGKSLIGWYIGSSAGFAMVFALLIAAIIWNLGTWAFGLPASSSHTLVGSIIGVGVTNALLHGRSGTSGVDWSKAKEVGEALLVSPLFGFALAAVLLLILKSIVRIPALYAEPKGDHPPPWWIRGILILTCTLVSFFHGSNDGQKGVGLIMLILIGTVPTAYALNRSMPDSQLQTFASTSQAASAVIEQKASGYNVLGNPRPAVTAYVSSHEPRYRIQRSSALALAKKRNARLVARIRPFQGLKDG